MASWGLDGTEQSKWERLAAVADSGAAENVSPDGATSRSEASTGFRGAGGERIRNRGQRKLKVRMSDGHVARSTWQVTAVRPLTSVAQMVAAGNRVHLDSKDPRIARRKGDVIPLRQAGNVFVIDLCVRKDATSSPVRSEGVVQRRKVADLRAVEDGQGECESRVGTPCGASHAVPGLVQALRGWKRSRTSTPEASSAR